MVSSDGNASMAWDYVGLMCNFCSLVQERTSWDAGPNAATILKPLVPHPLPTESLFYVTGYHADWDAKFPHNHHPLLLTLNSSIPMTVKYQAVNRPATKITGNQKTRSRMSKKNVEEKKLKKNTDCSVTGHFTPGQFPPALSPPGTSLHGQFPP